MQYTYKGIDFNIYVYHKGDNCRVCIPGHTVTFSSCLNYKLTYTITAEHKGNTMPLTSLKAKHYEQIADRCVEAAYNLFVDNKCIKLL